jgi:inhibitor of cysteine peptidase
MGTGCFLRVLILLIVFSVVVLMIAVGGCEHAQQSDSQLKAEMAKSPDSPSEVTVRVGENFWIWAKSNPTTGFQWQLATPLNAVLLKMEDSGFQAPPQQEGVQRVGVPGQQWWELKAIAAGDAIIEIAYQRSWEGSQTPADARKYQITIKP